MQEASRFALARVILESRSRWWRDWTSELVHFLNKEKTTSARALGLTEADNSIISMTVPQELIDLNRKHVSVITGRGLQVFNEQSSSTPRRVHIVGREQRRPHHSRVSNHKDRSRRKSPHWRCCGLSYGKSSRTLYVLVSQVWSSACIRKYLSPLLISYASQSCHLAQQPELNPNRV